MLLGILRTLPPWLAISLTRGLLHVVMVFLPRRRKIMMDNLGASFPDWTTDQCREVAGEVIGNLAKGINVFVRLDQLAQTRFGGLVNAQGLHHFDEALRHGKGV